VSTRENSGSRPGKYWLRYPTFVTGAACLISLLLTPWTFLPFTYAQFTLARRAIFPWVTWYEGFFRKADDAFHWVVWAPLPVLVLGSALMLRWLAGKLIARWSPRPWARVRRGARLATALAMALALLPSGAVLGLVLAVNLPWYGPEITPASAAGAVWYQARCRGCHRSENVLPLCITRGPQRWDEIVGRMRTRYKVSLGDGQAADVAAYLKLIGSYSDAQLFRAKCLRCHDERRLRDTPRTAARWDQIVDRVARVSPFAFRPDWTRQVKRHARRELARQPEAGSADAARDRFEQKCGGCHSLDLATRGATPAVLRRMAAKVEGQISDADLSLIAPYIKTLPVKEPGAFRALFPHDKVVEVEW